MTENKENSILRDILLEAAEKEFSQELFEHEQVNVSSRFIREMESMVYNPNRWAKRHKRPRWKKILNIAASIALACSLSLGTLMIFSPTVRAAIVEWVTEWYETYVIYRFFGDQDSIEMPLYKILDLPQGYVETESSIEFSNNIEIHYENEEGDILRFEYVRVEEGSAILIDAENMEVENVTVNGCPGHLYISADEKQSSCITWYDDEVHIQFVIDGFFEKDLLMKMACSVSKCSGRV